MHLEYFGGSMFQALEQVAQAYPGSVAFDFMGKSTTYKKMIQEIERCAKSLKVLGIRAGGQGDHRHAQLPPGHLYVLRRKPGGGHR